MAKFARIFLFVGFMLSVPIGLVAQAQSPSCSSPQGSGACLPWGFTESTVGEIMDLSRDGSAVAGEIGSFVTHWDSNLGLDLLSLPGNESILINRPSMSGNGLVITGRGTNPQAGPVFAAFRWDVSTDTTIILPSGPTSGIDNVFLGRTNGTITPVDRPTISVDGNTIVGGGFAVDGVGSSGGGLNQFPWIFRWTASGGTSDIPQNSFSDQLGSFLVSGDGISVVADLNNASFTSARWRPSSVTNLGISTSAVRAVSYDGEVIAGTYNPGSGLIGYRWTQSGGVQGLSTLVLPRAISDDGNVITSLNPSPPPPFAFTEPWIWDPVQGDQWMFDYLSSNYGFPLSLFFYGSVDPYGLVSGDGNVFSMTGGDWIVKVSPIEVVVLGDSYSSGEGVPNFEVGTDSPNINQCHRSLKAYSTLARPRTATRTLQSLADPTTGRPGFSWDFVSCSGATSTNILPVSEGGEGQWPLTFDADPQLDQGVVDADTDLVVISIGGNDLFFEDLITACYLYPDCFDRLAPERGIDWDNFLPGHTTGVVKNALRAVYEEIESIAPQAAVVVFDYPLAVNSTSTCENAFGLGFSEDELAFLIGAGDHLNNVLKDAASEIGVHVIEISKQFVGHEVCSTAPLFVGLNLRKENRAHSFHPNERGQQEYAVALNKFLTDTGVSYAHGFHESGMPVNPPAVP